MKNSILCADFDFYYLLVVAFLHVLLVNFNFFFFYLFIWQKCCGVKSNERARVVPSVQFSYYYQTRCTVHNTLNSHVSNLCADFIFHFFIAQKSGALRAPVLVEIKFIFFQLYIKKYFHFNSGYAKKKMYKFFSFIVGPAAQAHFLSLMGARRHFTKIKKRIHHHKSNIQPH